GKPLAHIGGKTMIERVYGQAKKALDEVLVATDDYRILNHVLGFGGKAVMTRPEHPSGTDRCFEAYCKHNQNFDFALNIQGDEPFIQPEQITQLVTALRQPGSQIATLARRITEPANLHSPNVVKLALSLQHEALYFSRHPIPYLRGAEP